MKPRVLLLAQVPPPYHGQAVMQQYLVQSTWNWCERTHVRMNFSDDLESVGKPSVRKVWRLLQLLARCAVVRLHGPIDLLIYPPSGDSPTGTVRDVLVLLFVRPLVKRVVFHFHAGNFHSSLEALPRALKPLARHAFARPSVALVLSPSLADEVRGIAPARVVVVRNGIPDVFATGVPSRDDHGTVRILYIGTLSRQKGTGSLIQAAADLADSGVHVAVDLVGQFDDGEFAREIETILEDRGITDRVVFHGTKTGAPKWQCFVTADVFCFPTAYPRENQPVAVIEAMMAGLPIVATRWRAIPDLIDHRREGLLTPVGDTRALGDALRSLALSPAMRSDLGKAARARYELAHRLEDHLRRVEHAARTTVELDLQGGDRGMIDEAPD